MPRLWDLEPVTGARIRSSRATDRRYERDAAGDMIHVRRIGCRLDRTWHAGPAGRHHCVLRRFFWLIEKRRGHPLIAVHHLRSRQVWPVIATTVLTLASAG